jgi:sporulation integral membrane protein YtvI
MPESVKRTLLLILKIALIILAIFLFARGVKYVVPFLLAFIFASLIEPVVKFLEKKIRIPRKIGTVLSILLVIGAIVAVFALLISRLINEITNVYQSLSQNMTGISSFFDGLFNEINGIYIQLPTEVTDLINTAGQNLANELKGLLSSIINLAQIPIQFALDLPQVLVFIVITILATYFMSSDKNTILNFLDGQIPSDWLKKTRAISNNIFSALLGWIRAQLILMSITFSELLIGLLIIGVKNALLIALIIALVDVLPVLGAGTVLIPWSIINLITGQTKLGLSLFLLYVIILFVRQLIEPKIVGQQIGVHPLFTLAGMYIGLRIFGVLGMFVGPITVVVLKYILEGVFKTDSFKGWFENTFRSKRKVVISSDLHVKENEKKVNVKSH